MKIYCGGRTNGKTMKAIRLSVEKQMPIICWSHEHRAIVDDLDILLRMILDDNVYYATMEDCNIEELRRSDT